MRVVALPCAAGLRLLVDGVAPPCFPRVVLRQELALRAVCQGRHHILEFPHHPQPRVFLQVPPCYLDHMELAHLYRITRELAEQARHSVYDEAAYRVSASLYRRYGIPVVGDLLVGDERQVKHLSRRILHSCKYSPVAPPVGRIKVDKPSSAYLWLLPSTGYCGQPALYRRLACAVPPRQGRHCLFPREVFLPQGFGGDLSPCSELSLAQAAFIQLHPVSGAVLTRVRRTARRTFFYSYRTY